MTRAIRAWAQGRSRRAAAGRQPHRRGARGAGAGGARAAGGQPVGAGRRARRSRGSLTSSVAVVPPPRTIERILERAGATERRRPGRRASKGIPYPAPTAERPGDVVQVDLVGPRHLAGGVRFHALNQIDVASHQAGDRDRHRPRRRARDRRRCMRCGAVSGCRAGRSSTTAARSAAPTGDRRGRARAACTRASRRCSCRRASHGATARSSTSTTPSTSASSATSASATASSSPNAPARSSASTTPSTATARPPAELLTRPPAQPSASAPAGARSPPAGPRHGRDSSSSASSAQTTSCACSAARSAMPDTTAYQYLQARYSRGPALVGTRLAHGAQTTATRRGRASDA